MKRKRIGVVADDITGANDIGVMFAQNGYAVTVIALENDPDARDFEDTDVLVIHTGSRLDSAKTAALKTRRAASFLRDQSCDLIYTKTCSVFRGNIGASFDAVQDVLSVKTSMVVAGFPRNGRTTLHGVHYLNQVPVDQTSFAHDPVTPLRFSRLDQLIGCQSHRLCRNFTADWLDQPDEIRRIHLDMLKKEAAYVIFDVRDQEDLKQIAALIAEEPSICGSSAICEELPKAWRDETAPRPCPYTAAGGGGVMILAGSLTPQTAEQVALLEKQGAARCVMDPALLLSETGRAREVRRAADFSAVHLAAGEDVLVYVSRDTEKVRSASELLGLNEIDAGRCISLAFETLVRTVHSETGITRYVVAGGETSDSVSRGLGVRSMRIWQEIEAGVPVMTGLTQDGNRLLLVFKSGSFGSPVFLMKAADTLRGGNARFQTEHSEGEKHEMDE